MRLKPQYKTLKFWAIMCGSRKEKGFDIFSQLSFISPSFKNISVDNYWLLFFRCTLNIWPSVPPSSPRLRAASAGCMSAVSTMIDVLISYKAVLIKNCVYIFYSSILTNIKQQFSDFPRAKLPLCLLRPIYAAAE